MFCKNCKWWNDGVCDRIGIKDAGFGWNQNPAILFEIEVTVDDDSNLNCVLRTGPEFGCIRFEARE